VKHEAEAYMRQQLKIQTQAHSDHLADVLAVKEKEMERHFNRILNEKLEEEQAAYKIEIGAMLGRLRGMDDALKCNVLYLLVYNTHPYFLIGKLKIDYSCFTCFEINKI
jgi:hypothetical protein